MKVLYVITGLAIGGAEQALVELTKEGVDRGHKIWVVSLTPVCPQFIKRFESTIIISEVDLTGFYGKCVGIISFSRYVLQVDPDVIHAHMVHSNIFVGICKFLRFIRAPVVVTAHSVNEGKVSWAYRLVRRYFYSAIHISKVGLDSYRDKNYFSLNSSLFIPNGISLQPDSVEKIHSSGRPRYIAVGRLSFEKNFEFMIRAFAKLKEAEVPFQLSILGDGPLRTDLQNLIVNLGLSEEITILGFVDDVRHRLNSSDYFLMSSNYEGMPVSLLEACDSGLPSLVTDVGSCGEVVRGLPNCYVVKVGDLDDYVRSLLSLAKLGPANYASSRVLIRERVRDRYSVVATFSHLEDIYGKAVITELD